jgi:hypothetical protein
MDVIEYLISGLLLIVLGGGWLLERVFARHHRQVEFSLTSIQTVLLEIRDQNDPLRQKKVQVLLADLRASFPSIEKEIDEDYAETVLRAKRKAENWNLLFMDRSEGAKDVAADLREYDNKLLFHAQLLIDASPETIRDYLLSLSKDHAAGLIVEVWKKMNRRWV